MPLVAGDVKLPPDLSSVFSGIGTNAYNKIGQNYGAAGSRMTFDPSTGGPGSGTTDYQRQRLAATQGLDIGNLEAGVGSQLGQTAYSNQLSQRDYEQQKYLTDLIGDAAAPSELQQIFSGIGGGARAATPWLALRGMNADPYLNTGIYGPYHQPANVPPI